MTQRGAIGLILLDVFATWNMIWHSWKLVKAVETTDQYKIMHLGKTNPQIEYNIGIDVGIFFF